MHSVLETSIFTRQADALLAREDRDALILVLSSNPKVGVVVPGLEGVRKLRFAPGGRGKSGGFRVLYYVMDENRPIYAMLLYGKNEQANLTPPQRKVLLRLLDAYKADARGR